MRAQFHHRKSQPPGGDDDARPADVIPAYLPTFYFGDLPSLHPDCFMVGVPVPVGHACGGCTALINVSDRGIFWETMVRPMTFALIPAHTECHILRRFGTMEIVKEIYTELGAPHFEVPPNATFRQQARVALRYVNSVRGMNGLDLL